MNALILKKGREKSLKRRHPWIFSGAVEKVERQAGRAKRVEVRDRAARCWRAPPTARSRRSARGSGPSMPAEQVDALSSATGCRRRSRCASAAGGEAHQRAAPGASANPTACRAWWSTATPTCWSRSSSPPGVERWRDADPGCSDGTVRLRSDLRALGCRGAQARGPGAARRVRARQPQRHALPDRRVRPQLPRRRRAGPEDRLLPRPAREPPARARARRGARGARRLLLHRRLLDRRAGRRREARHRGRELRARARGREGEPGRQPARCFEGASSSRPTSSRTCASCATRTRSSTSSCSTRRSSRRPRRR